MITLAKGAATKHYQLDGNGRIAKGGGSISSGIVHVVETTLAEIANCPPNTFMQSDVPKGAALWGDEYVYEGLDLPTVLQIVTGTLARSLQRAAPGLQHPCR